MTVLKKMGDFIGGVLGQRREICLRRMGVDSLECFLLGTDAAFVNVIKKNEEQSAK